MSSSSLSSWGQSEQCLYTCVVEDSYGRIIQPYSPAPFCNTMGQPFVYYTQVWLRGWYRYKKIRGGTKFAGTECEKKCSKRKHNRNCFVKAFHWYTQDLSDKPDDNSEQCPDVKGFAAWLDSKYCEYQQESEVLRVHHLQSSTTDATPCPPCCPPCQPGTTRKKKFQRMRSPWRKRKCGNKNAGDVTSKAKSPTASCQFILQPQDLNRPGSESGYQPPICEHRSNTTITISKEYRESNRCVAKSRSMTSIYDETCIRNDINTKPVQKAPPCEAKRSVTLVPCDQKCQQPTEQENKMSQEIPQVLPKAQKVPCDPPCTIQQPQQVCYQNPTTKQQCIIKDKIQEDHPSAIQQNSTNKQEFKIREEIRQVPSKAQTVPCDPPCTIHQPQQVCYKNPTAKQEFKIREEIRQDPSKVQTVPCDPPCIIQQPHQVCYQKPTVKQECKIKKEIPSNSQKQTCEPGITQEQVSLQSHVLEISRNVDRNKQECKIVEKTESMISVSQKIDNPCDECYKTIPCDTCYVPKQEPKIKHDTRQLPAKAHEYKKCDEDCTTKEACRITQEMREQHAKVQKELMQAVHQTSPYLTCQESCPTSQDCKIMEKLKLMSRQWSNIPCDQSCVANKESKLVDERPSLSKQLTTDRSICHKFCTTKEKCKFFEELLLRASNRSGYQTCMPKQECKFLSQNPVKPQKIQTVCEPKEIKMVDEIQVHTQSQGTSLHCEPISLQYVKTDTKKKPRKQNIECQCPEESLAIKQNNSLQIETKYTPPKYTGQIATSTSVQVKSSKREMDIECQCPPESPPSVQAPKIKSSKREMDIECQCPPEPSTPAQAPKVKSSKREMYIECQCPPEPPSTVQAPKVKSSKREMDIKCQCPPEPPSPVQVNTSKREMETECECPPELPPLVQAHKVKSSKREIDIECQCPPGPSSLVAVPKVKSRIRAMDIECECPQDSPPPIQAPKVKSSKREMDIECECPPETPPPVQAPKVKSRNRKIDIECECPPEAPTPVQAPKVKSSKREMDIECQCPPESPPSVVCMPPKVQLSKREMDIECQCPPEAPTPVQVPKVKSSKREMDIECPPESPPSVVCVLPKVKSGKREMDIECQCPPESPPSVVCVLPKVKPIKRQMDVDCLCPEEAPPPVPEVKPIKQEMDNCECPEERSSFVQVKIRHTDIERQCSIKPINPAQKKPSKRQIDIECQCPPEIPTSVHPVQVQKPPKKRKVGIDCECPQEKSVPVVEQSIVSTSTNDSCCKCIVVEEPQRTPEKIPPTKRIIQPRTQINTSIKFVKSKEKVCDTSCQCSTEDVLQQDTSRQRGRFLQVKTKTSNNKISLNTNLTITTVDKSCQCSEEDILFVLHYHVDKSCQYNRSDFESRREIVCSGPEPEKPRTICTAQRTDSFTVKNMVSVRKVTCSRSIFRCDGVQTSDHSISLENDDDHDYEFFMKIVCADKLNDCPCFND